MEFVVLVTCTLIIACCIKLIEKMIKARREIQINRELRRMYMDGMVSELNGHSVEEWRLMCEASEQASRARRQKKG